jgi:hypothetical protein
MCQKYFVNDPLVDIYFQLYTKWVDNSTYLVAPNYSFNIKKYIVKNVIENDINQKWGGSKREFSINVVHVYEIFS